MGIAEGNVRRAASIRAVRLVLSPISNSCPLFSGLGILMFCLKNNTYLFTTFSHHFNSPSHPNILLQLSLISPLLHLPKELYISSYS